MTPRAAHRRSLILAAFVSCAACATVPPVEQPLAVSAPVSAIEDRRPETPAADELAARDPEEVAFALELRVFKLAAAMNERRLREQMGPRSETIECAFYLGPGDRPRSGDGSMPWTPDALPTGDDLDRLAHDISACRATLADDESRAAFDRDVVVPFASVRAQIAAAAAPK